MVLGGDGYLYIYTDGARPTRPLLIVDPTNNELVIKNKNLWNANMKTLLEEGCVEYIDAFEQEYIQLAQTLNDIDLRKAELDEALRNHQNVDVVGRKSFEHLKSDARMPLHSHADHADFGDIPIHLHALDFHFPGDRVNRLPGFDQIVCAGGERYIRQSVFPDVLDDHVNIDVASRQFAEQAGRDAGFVGQT